MINPFRSHYFQVIEYQFITGLYHDNARTYITPVAEFVQLTKAR